MTWQLVFGSVSIVALFFTEFSKAEEAYISSPNQKIVYSRAFMDHPPEENETVSTAPPEENGKESTAKRNYRALDLWIPIDHFFEDAYQVYVA